MASNYEDDLKALDGEERAATDASNKTYDDMVADNNAEKDGLVSEIKANQQRQEQIQNEQTDFAIEQIEQQKAQTHKDYIKEQSGAYVDWQKQSNQYGAEAEQKAANGLTNTGFSESSQVSMYNAYQNRIATARETYSRAVLNYDNAITQARLQNSSALAEIAAQALAESLQVSLQYAQMNNSLLTQKANAQMQIKHLYQNKWATLLDQIYKEDSLAQNQAQFDAEMAFKREQFAWQKEQAASSGGGGGGGTINKSSKKSSNYITAKNKDGSTAVVDKRNPKGTNTSSNNSGSAPKLKVSQRSWKLNDDGGVNWFWGVDGNAKYTDQFGMTVSGDKLVDLLVDEGFKKKDAKEYVKALQKATGATK